MKRLEPCPDCGTETHQRATLCPQCGRPSALTAFQEQLASLSTMCSILVGFTLAGVVQLAIDVEKVGASLCLTGAVALWLSSAIVQLTVLVLSELLRRKEVSASVFQPPEDKVKDYARRCDLLLTCFSLSLIATTSGVVLLGFHFSLLHGLIGLAALVPALLVIYWVMVG